MIVCQSSPTCDTESETTHSVIDSVAISARRDIWHNCGDFSHAISQLMLLSESIDADKAGFLVVSLFSQCFVMITANGEVPVGQIVVPSFRSNRWKRCVADFALVRCRPSG